MRTGVLLILFILSSGWVFSQSSEAIKDLREYWTVSKDGHLENYQSQPVKSINLSVIDPFRGGIISIKTPGEFTLFINGQLQLRTRSELKLNVDSLLNARGGTPLLSIFYEGNTKAIQTKLIYRTHLENEKFNRESTHFTDFMILSLLLLFGFFVILFRSNTRLTIDYLNLTKVFSIQEREEAIVTGRIATSANILFFVFISLLFSLLLIILFKSGPPALHFSSRVSIQTTAEAFMWWLILSFVIFIFLISKLLLIWSLSEVFNFKGIVRFQFFNFIRSLYVASAIMGIVLLVYFMLGVRYPEFFYFLLALVCGFMSLSVFFLSFKLMTRTSSSFFHLFSYLCGSEIIPLVILIKLLLN